MKRYAAIVVAMVLGLGIANASYAGPVAGPGTSVKTVQARSSVWYNEVFRGGESGLVSLVGDGSTDVDVYVYDGNGRLVVSGIGLTDIESVRFYAPSTQTYRIEVRNLGNTWNQLILMTD